MLKELKHQLNRTVGRILSSPFSVTLIKKLHKDYIVANGLRFTYKNPLINNSIISSIFWGYYERTERKTIEKFLKKNLPIIELGSSIGYVTLNLFKKAPGTKIISVEGNPNLVPILKENFKLNNAGNIKLINAVVSYSKEDKVEFVIDEGNLGSQLGSLAGKSASNSVYIDSITLKEILISENITGPFVLVSDIEGAEYFLFKHEQDEMVKKNCSQIIIELHDMVDNGKKIKKEDIAKLIRENWGLLPIEKNNNVWVFEKDVK